MRHDLTVKQFAEQEGVTPRQVRAWIDKGAIEIRRTPGNGIRVIIERPPLFVMNAPTRSEA